MSRPDFRYFAVFGMMRTGSNLLERLINQYAGLQCHGELFNPHFIGVSGTVEWHGLTMQEREDDPQSLIKRMTAIDDGLPGFRIFDGHDPRVEATALADPTCAKIILKRRPIDSYVSLEIAKKTDQWILGNAMSRRTAQITFDPPSYDRYLATLEAYYSRVSRALQESGQTAFTVSYDDLKDADVMNGMAAYLGSKERRTNFAEPIKRQNPEPLAEKVTNYPDLVEALGSGIDNTQRVGAGAQVSIRDIAVSKSKPVLVAPVPGTARKPLIDWLRTISGGSGQVNRGMSRGELKDWLDAADGLIAISLVEHPMSRAYRVFQKRILSEENGFPVVRQKLVSHYGMEIPNSKSTAAETTAAFEVFLSFLKTNLSQQTSIRIDPEWGLQSEYIAATTAITPLTHVIRAFEFPKAAARIATDLDIDAIGTTSTTHGGGVPLAEIYSKRLENLTRAAYARDYRELGFGNWAQD